MSIQAVLLEILSLVILTVVIAYIFSGYVRSPKKRLLLAERRERSTQRTLFDWDDFKFSLLIAAPGIVIHELAHKFFAIGFGSAATFKLFPLGIALGLVLRLVKSPILIVAPGFVEIADKNLSPVMLGLVAFAGPFINLLLWLVPLTILKLSKRVGRRLNRNVALFLFYTSFINMWLFIFNMLPIPPLDGSKVLFGLINALR